MTKLQIHQAVAAANVKGEGWYPGPNCSKATRRMMAEMEKSGWLEFVSGYGWKVKPKGATTPNPNPRNP